MRVVDHGGRLDTLPPIGRASACQAHVFGDLEEPRRLRTGDDSLLERAKGVQERGLECIFGVEPVTEAIEAERVDLPPVAQKELLGPLSRPDGCHVTHMCPSGRRWGTGCRNPYETLASS